MVGKSKEGKSIPFDDPNHEVAFTSPKNAGLLLAGLIKVPGLIVREAFSFGKTVAVTFKREKPRK